MICVVTSTHFSIGAGERSDAPGFFDALLEGEGKWWRGVMEEAGENMWDGAGDIEAPSESETRVFLTRSPPEPGALMGEMRSRDQVADGRMGLKAEMGN